jgi:hypothetical protein
MVEMILNHGLDWKNIYEQGDHIYITHTNNQCKNMLSQYGDIAEYDQVTSTCTLLDYMAAKDTSLYVKKGDNTKNNTNIQYIKTHDIHEGNFDRCKFLCNEDDSCLYVTHDALHNKCETIHMIQKPNTELYIKS